MSTASQEAFEREPGPGLRSLKKHKTRLAIRDAALELFADQGFEGTTVDQIAARAEVSTATLFRYFKTKSDVVFGGEGDEREYQLPALGRAIAERPSYENDLSAVRHAVLDEWVPHLDRTRLMRQFRASESSPLLRGLSSNLAHKWQATISAAVAQRHQLSEPDRRCKLVAALALAVFTSSTTAWVQDDSEDLSVEIDRGFELMTQLYTEWYETSH